MVLLASRKILSTHSPPERKFALTLTRLLAVAGLAPKTSKPLSSRFPHASEAAVSLLQALLVWDPERRATVRQALHHPYLGETIDAGCEGCVSIQDDSLDCDDPFEALQAEVESFKGDQRLMRRGPSPLSATPTGAPAAADSGPRSQPSGGYDVTSTSCSLSECSLEDKGLAAPREEGMPPSSNREAGAATSDASRFSKFFGECVDSESHKARGSSSTDSFERGVIVPATA